MKPELKALLEEVEIANYHEVADVLMQSVTSTISDYMLEVDCFAERSNYNNMYISEMCKVGDSLQDLMRHSKSISDIAYDSH